MLPSANTLEGVETKDLENVPALRENWSVDFRSECPYLWFADGGRSLFTTMALRVPYTQQFTPEQTPLKRLLAILRQNAGDPDGLRDAIAGGFFKGKADPGKLAGNTLIALRSYGIIDDVASLTAFGKQLVDLQGSEEQAHRLLAKRILLHLDGVGIVETLREMNRARLVVALKTLPTELRQRGFEASSSSSDLSGVLNWLRQAGVLLGYDVNETEYAALVGAQPETLDALKGLNRDQVAFLRAALALNVTEWCSYNRICKHAEQLYAGEIRYNWKEIVGTVLEPLQEAGLIEIRKKAKQATDTPEGRGGKPADVRPTSKFEGDLAEPLLGALYRSAGFAEIREIRSKPLAEIVAQIEHAADQNRRARALELLAIRLCQMLDLNFLGWRETDVEIAAGGEVDAILHAARLIYSRWQVQCKIGQVTLEAVAKEVGMQNVTLANVILVVGTKKATQGALTFRKKIVSTSNLNIIIIDGPLLKKIIDDNSMLVDILHAQAEDALKMKPALSGMKPPPPSGSGEPWEMTSENGPCQAAPAANKRFSAAYATTLGRMFCGDSLEVLPSLIGQGTRVKLIVTSPPFALVRKKDYGNEDSDRYVRWFEQFIPLFRRILDPDGSLVIDIGGAWIKGLPVKSTYHFKLLLRLCESGFYLAQDFYHYNPARLPAPAEWVTVRRLRVKDAINNVWWLTLDPFVKVDNRRVLLPYSDSMKQLLRNGYKPRLRPSGHDISAKFQKDNTGAIPPNLLEFANTESNSYYLRRCKQDNIKPHPARFPQALPEFFITLLTDPGDLVLDPFSGSNASGAAAEALGRQWVSIELDSTYVAGSRFRFERPPRPTYEPSRRHRKEIPTPSTQPHLLFDWNGSDAAQEPSL